MNLGTAYGAAYRNGNVAVLLRLTVCLVKAPVSTK
jgi:hypothetical protein